MAEKKDRMLYAVLAYSVIWISGLILYFVEKEDKVIRFHAARSMILFFGVLILGLIPILNFFVYLIGVILWVYLIIKSILDKGEKFEIPLLSQYVDKFAEELANK